MRVWMEQPRRLALLPSLPVLQDTVTDIWTSTKTQPASWPKSHLSSAKNFALARLKRFLHQLQQKFLRTARAIFPSTFHFRLITTFALTPAFLTPTKANLFSNLITASTKINFQ